MALEPQIPEDRIYHKSFPANSALEGTPTEDDFSDAITPKTYDVEEGDWVSINDSGEAVAGDNTDILAFPVWTAGGRYDVRHSGEITVLWGPHIAMTNRIKTDAGTGQITTSTTVGSLLGVETSGNGGKILRVAQSGDRIVAILTGQLDAQASGYIEYMTYPMYTATVA